MPQQEHARIVCPGCGTGYRWKPELAGRKVQCKCGKVMRMPAEVGGAAAAAAKPAAGRPAPPGPASTPPVATEAASAASDRLQPGGGDEYELDLTDQPKPASRQPGAMAGHPLQVGAPAVPGAPGAPGAAKPGRCPSCGGSIKPEAVLCLNCGFNLQLGTKLQTTLVPAGEEGSLAPDLATLRPSLAAMSGSRLKGSAVDEAAILRKARMIDLYIPIFLIALGIGFALVQAFFYDEDIAGFLGAMISVGLQIVFIVPLLLVGIVIAARLLEVSFGPFGIALLKLMAIALGPGAIGGIVAALLGGGIGPMLLGWVISMIMYWVLMAILFSLEPMEALFTLIIISVLRDWVLVYLITIIGPMFF